MLGAIRAAVGDTATPILNSSQALVAGTTIAITSGVAFQVCPVTSTANITLTSNPQIASGSNGQRVRVHNAGANVIAFQDTNGISLNGTLALGSTQWAEFIHASGFWQLADTNGAPVWAAVSFQNSWVNAAGFQACQYTKIRGEVLMRGYASRPLAFAAGAICTLPVGFRPSSTMRYPVENFGTNANVVLGCGTDGAINFNALGSPANPQQVTLAGIRFFT
jgi:hypothetical protein